MVKLIFSSLEGDMVSCVCSSIEGYVCQLIVRLFRCPFSLVGLCTVFAINQSIKFLDVLYHFVCICNEWF